MCPVFPGSGERLHWGFDDPSGFQGTHEEKLEKTKRARDMIKAAIDDWVKKVDQVLF